jgi:hypothetical protein
MMTAEKRLQWLSRHLTFTDHAKQAGRAWQNLSLNEKKDYLIQAAIAKAKFNADYNEYKKTEDYRRYQEYLEEFREEHPGTYNPSRRTAFRGRATGSRSGSTTIAAPSPIEPQAECTFAPQTSAIEGFERRHGSTSLEPYHRESSSIIQPSYQAVSVTGHRKETTFPPLVRPEPCCHSQGDRAYYSNPSDNHYQLPPLHLYIPTSKSTPTTSLPFSGPTPSMGAPVHMRPPFPSPSTNYQYNRFTRAATGDTTLSSHERYIPTRQFQKCPDYELPSSNSQTQSYPHLYD